MQSPTHKECKGTKLRTVIASILFFFLTIKLLFVDSFPINPDCAIYLQAGAMILSGKLPYNDFFDINPPLVFYLHTIPIALADFLFLDRIWLFKLLSVGMAVLAWICQKNLNDGNGEKSHVPPDLILAIPILTLIASEWGEFGQRHLLFSVWLVPFVLIRCLRYELRSFSKSISFLVGGFYGLSACLIPQYLIINAALELYWLVRYKNIRLLFAVENILVAIVAGIYFALFLCNPQISEPFIHHNLPLVVRGYAAYDWPPNMILLATTLSGILPLMLFSVIVRKWSTKTNNGFFVPFVISTMAGIFSVLLQGKCYPNQLLPAVAGSLCLWLVAVANLPYKYLLVRVILTLLIPCMFLIPFQSKYYRDHVDQFVNANIRELVEKETKPGDRVAIFSLALPDSFPILLEMRRVSCSPYFFFYPIKMLEYLAKKADSALAKGFVNEERAFAIQRVCDSIDRENPLLVLIQDTNDRLSVSNVLNQSEQFKRLMEKYAFIGDCQGRALLHVYKLKD